MSQTGWVTNADRIADHYHQADLAAAIEAGFAELDRSVEGLTVDDLAIVDEFHVGGRAATASLLAQLDLAPDQRVLDVGAGLGGPARYAASTFGCEVVGIDLTPSYVAAARTLTEWVNLEHRITFQQASAQSMGFDAASFDAAYQLHVGMNIADKAEVFAAVAESLKPGGRLGIYDLARTGPGELDYPMPWANSADHSFVASQATYESALIAAGFEVVQVEARHDMAQVFVDASSGRGGPPGPVGLALVMGPTIGSKVANLSSALQAGVLTPIELVARLRS